MEGFDTGDLVGNAPVPIVVYDAEGLLVRANDAAADFVGADDPAALEGEPVEQFVADSEADVLRERLSTVLSEREAVGPRELELRTLDGEPRHAEVGGAPVEVDGEPGGQAILHDVTEKRRRQRRLERERDRLSALFDAVPEPTALFEFVDGEPIVRRINDAFEETFGYGADEVVGENVNEYVVPEDEREGARDIDASGAALEPVEREVTRATADGERRQFLFRSRPLRAGNELESIGVYVDVTDRKERERRLQRERDRFVTLFEHLPSPVVHGRYVDDEPVVERVNPAFEETFGVDGEDVVGENLDDLVVPDEDKEEARTINERIVEEGRIRREVRRETSDGLRDFVLDVVMREDEPTEGYSIYTDITEQRRRERELRRTNERLEDLAGVISHDLRSPLAVANTGLATYRRSGDEEHLDRVDDALDRIEALLDELIELARQGETVDDPEAVALDETAREAWATARTGEATLTVETDSRLCVDPVRLRELLQNLFENAAQHAGEAPAVTVGDLEDATGFYVADDGPGVPPDRREAVFEPGHTTADDGTGFGLAIVEEIAAAHGWTVELDDAPGGGARFAFEGVERPPC